MTGQVKFGQSWHSFWQDGSLCIPANNSIAPCLLPSLESVSANTHLRVAVDCARRGEDHVLAPVLVHGLAQVDCAQHVVVVVAQRVLHALIHILATRKVDHAVKPGVKEAERQGRSQLSTGSAAHSDD